MSTNTFKNKQPKQVSKEQIEQDHLNLEEKVANESLKKKNKKKQSSEQAQKEGVQKINEPKQNNGELTKKERKELRKMKKQLYNLLEEDEEEQEGAEELQSKGQLTLPVIQYGQKKRKGEEQQENSKLVQDKQRVEPKIIKKPKITIICDDDEDEESIVLQASKLKQDSKKLNNVNKHKKKEEQEVNSEVEEGEEERDNQKKAEFTDSEEENFKDIESNDEQEEIQQDFPKKKDKSKIQEENSNKSTKKKNKIPQLKTLSDKIQLKHLAICIPDSIISIPQSSELRSYFISELARTAAIFSVDEIIILKDNSYIAKSQNFQQGPYIARNLQYLETPQYLRKQLFPIHPDLKNAGLMNPIECHHHLKSDQYCKYREGVVLNRPVKENDGSWVEIGLQRQAKIPYKLAPSTRVTLKIKEDAIEINEKFYIAEVVSQKEPKEKLGLFWGYQVRLADNLNQVFKGENDIQYDIKILINQGDHPQLTQESILEAAPDFEGKSLLVVFSGYNNLESIIDSDEATNLSGKAALQKFNANFTMQKGSYGVKQLRLEEELAQGLSILRRKFN